MLPAAQRFGKVNNEGHSVFLVALNNSDEKIVDLFLRYSKKYQDAFFEELSHREAGKSSIYDQWSYAMLLKFKNSHADILSDKSSVLTENEKEAILILSKFGPDAVWAWVSGWACQMNQRYIFQDVAPKQSSMQCTTKSVDYVLQKNGFPIIRLWLENPDVEEFFQKWLEEVTQKDEISTNLQNVSLYLICILALKTKILKISNKIACGQAAQAGWSALLKSSKIITQI